MINASEENNINRSPTHTMMVDTPKFGTNTKPVSKLPSMLPKVDQKNIRPETLPIPLPGFWISSSLIANGESIPSKKLGRKNNTILIINGPEFNGNLKPTSGSI